MSGGPRCGIPFVVAAPSGTGKTTVCRRVVEAHDDIVFAVSHTTRAKRDGEVDGRDYYFVSLEAFQERIEADAFLEWAVYNGNHYGTSWESIEVPLAAGRDVLLEIEVQGARQVRNRRGDARLIFLFPPSFEALEERLSRRGTDSEEQIRKRLDLAREELAAVREFDYAVENDDLDCCVAAVETIVSAERDGLGASVRKRFSIAAAQARFDREG